MLLQGKSRLRMGRRQGGYTSLGVESSPNWVSVVSVMALLIACGAILGVILLGVLKQSTVQMDSVVRVGATRQFKTVTDVLKQYKQHHIGELKIVVDPGDYSESYFIGGDESHGFRFRDESNRTLSRGLKITGADVRGIDGTTYVDSYPSIDVESYFQTASHITDTDANVGPFTILISDDLLEMGGDLTYPFSAEVVLADPLDACTPLTNDLTGKIGLAIRGGCSFTQKGQNMANAGAVAHLIYNNVIGSLSIGGSEVMGGGPTFSMTNEDGTILKLAIEAGTVTLTLNAPAREFEPPAGSPSAKVDLVHPGADQSIVQVVLSDPFPGDPLEQPDFEAAGLIPGDRLVFVCPDGDYDFFGFLLPILFSHEEAIISSVSGNTITLTAPLGNDCSLPDSSMTIVPKVRVLGSLENDLPGPLLSVSGGAGVTIRGIYFSQPSDRVFRSGTNMAMITHAGAQLPNCVFYDRSDTFDPVLVSHGRLGADSGDADGRDRRVIAGRVDGPLAIIHNGFEAYASTVKVDALSVLGSRENSMLIGTSTVGVSYLQLIWSDGLFTRNSYGARLDESSLVSSFANVGRHPYLAYLALGSSNIQVEDALFAQRTGTYGLGGPFGSFGWLWTGVSLARENSHVSFGDFDGKENYGTDMVIFENSRGTIHIGRFSGLGYSSVDGTSPDVKLVSMGQNIIDVSTIPATLGNVLRHTSSGVVHHNYQENIVEGSTPIALTLDPSEEIEPTFVPGYYRFVGRTYRFTFEDNVAHTITLHTGSFTGLAIPGGSNRITLNASETHTCVELKVLSPGQVQICSGTQNITPSVVALRRNVPNKKSLPHEMTHISGGNLRSSRGNKNGKRY